MCDAKPAPRAHRSNAPSALQNSFALSVTEHRRQATPGQLCPHAPAGVFYPPRCLRGCVTLSQRIPADPFRVRQGRIEIERRQATNEISEKHGRPLRCCRSVLGLNLAAANQPLRMHREPRSEGHVRHRHRTRNPCPATSLCPLTHCRVLPDLSARRLTTTSRPSASRTPTTSDTYPLTNSSTCAGCSPLRAGAYVRHFSAVDGRSGSCAPHQSRGTIRIASSMETRSSNSASWAIATRLSRSHSSSIGPLACVAGLTRLSLGRFRCSSSGSDSSSTLPHQYRRL